MNTLHRYSVAAKQAADVMAKSLPKQGMTLVQEAEALSNKLASDICVKVPFVGDFNAGKSSLLNAMIGRDLLPTAIQPETAVSYEISYSPNEYLEVVKNEKNSGAYPLSDISTLSVKPGDIVRVYLNVPLIKEYQDKGIMLVDMPGIDSGIEAHNAAIAKYLTPGSRYMVFSDAEQGTIRSTAISFINELTKYDDIDFSLFLSKVDKKTPEDIVKIQKEATETISKVFPNHKVGLTSAINKDYGDVLKSLDSIDADQILSNKYKREVILIIDQMILTLQRNLQLLNSNVYDADKAIEEIQAKKIEAIANLNAKKQEAQPLDGSADDIVRDIKDAIVKNSASLASMLLHHSSQDQINNAILQIIRPVFVNSFKRELSEYQEVISSAIVDFSVDVDKILNDSDNSILAGAQEIAGQLVGKDIIEGLLVKGLEKAAAKFAGYKGIGALLNSLSKILGPLATILVNIIPDILKMIFGKSQEKKLAEIQAKICNDVATRISEGMRDEVERLLEEQRNYADRQMLELIEKEAKQVDESIRESVNEKTKEKERIQETIVELSEAIKTLADIKTTL